MAAREALAARLDHKTLWPREKRWLPALITKRYWSREKRWPLALITKRYGRARSAGCPP
jgi:hypothetical protein